MDSILFFCGYPPCPYHNDCKSLLKNNNCVKQKVYSFILCLEEPLEGSYCNIVCVCYECINTYLNLDYILIYLELHDAYKHFFFHLGMNEGKKKKQVHWPWNSMKNYTSKYLTVLRQEILQQEFFLHWFITVLDTVKGKVCMSLLQQIKMAQWNKTALKGPPTINIILKD